MDSGRIVSQTFLQPPGQLPAKKRKLRCNVVNAFPQIAIQNPRVKTEEDLEVVLVNGCWDTTNKIPNIVAEMRNVNAEDFNQLQNLPRFPSIDAEPRNFTSPSPRGSDSGIESDCTDGNLSWLLNYKIQELPPVPDASNAENIAPTFQTDSSTNGVQPQFLQVPQQNNEIVSQVKGDASRNSAQYCRYGGPKKPPFTYTELIEYALSEQRELTVSGIYQWISDHFPFYKQNDDRWKNSVRHNLSINPHFRKGGKAVQGAGHLWTIAQRDDKKSWQIKERMNQFMQKTRKEIKTPEQEAFDKELQAATESILGEMEIEPAKQTVETPIFEKKSNNIEIEYINLADVSHGLEDFLSPPVSKQEIVDECGLGNDFFITDINPTTLGLNLVESETHNEEGVYESVFEYYKE
ncbi:unnamed protein product [Acanthoscelides obtectus]|uniref:Fork-head domain-containing protein n=1 Tax=Acanthoscelides obtectus TaxID=200917 RepID=A0A9P0P303_ACAOB|nr:unnamed protein product [Acanthoscelides obtectus]CAK1670025.1 Forkhead transcription factor HCM1 [Acanthoscelides obtectus]